MGEVFNITHDADNLDEYDAIVTDGGDLSTGTPGLAGTTAKMEALIDDTNSLYGEKSVAFSTSDFRLRVYVDPNTLAMDNAEGFTFCRSFDLVGGLYNSLIIIYLRYDGSSYEIGAGTYDDVGGEEWGGPFDVSDGPHYVEFYAERSATVGRVRVWIDGVAKWDTGAGLDNYDLFAAQDAIRFGSYFFNGTPGPGTVYLDEFLANDDGGEIGPVVPPGLSIPVAMRTYRNLREV